MRRGFLPRHLRGRCRQRRRRGARGKACDGACSAPCVERHSVIGLAENDGGLMFGDEDEWPVYCPDCGSITYKRIAWLLANTRLTCSGCGASLAYYRERMARDLDDAHRAVANFSKGLRVEKGAR